MESLEFLKHMRFLLRATKEGHVQSEKVWSALAQENPIDAAAATNSTDWYAKHPHVVDQEIQDEEKLALDAGCGYGRVAIPLLKIKGKLKNHRRGGIYCDVKYVFSSC